jgi:hypothetical protein
MGAMAAALTGGATGGAIGALIGGLIGYGIPEERARMYGRGVREGGIVMGWESCPGRGKTPSISSGKWAACGCEQICCSPTRGREAA